MFKKYDIEDLYLASINVTYPDKVYFDKEQKNLRTMVLVGYSYLTVVKHDENDNFIDLQDPKTVLKFRKSENEISYVIEYLEPLSKYYTRDGEKKISLNGKQSITLANSYYNQFYLDHLQSRSEKSI